MFKLSIGLWVFMLITANAFAANCSKGFILEDKTEAFQASQAATYRSVMNPDINPTQIYNETLEQARIIRLRSCPEYSQQSLEDDELRNLQKEYYRAAINSRRGSSSQLPNNNIHCRSYYIGNSLNTDCN